MTKIFQIHLSELPILNSDYLNEITLPQNGIGKKENNYWIINSTANIATNKPEFNDIVYTTNTLLQGAAAKEFEAVMIIDR